MGKKTRKDRIQSILQVTRVVWKQTEMKNINYFINNQIYSPEKLTWY